MKVTRSQLVLLLILMFVAIVGAAVLWHFREDIGREQFMAVMERLTKMGPFVYFGLMAILPLFWVPVSPFLLLAPAFGMEKAVVGSVCALSVNLLIAWFVSAKWFRPLIVRLVSRFGYSVPEISDKSMVGVAVLLRITPGMPFPLQNYLLGLAEMPLAKYLAVSLPIVWATSSSVVILGESIMTGNAQLALIAIAVAVLVALALRFWRTRLQARAISQGK